MAKKDEIKKYRQEIADLSDYNLSAEIYDRFNAEEEFTQKDKQALHVELSTKVNELKQAAHDEADANGDKAAAAAAIAPEPPSLGAKGEKLQKSLIKSESERIAEGKQKPIHVPEGCKAEEITAEELAAINQDPKRSEKLVGVRPINPPMKTDEDGNPTRIQKYVAIMKVAVMALFIALGLSGSGMAAVDSSDEAVLGGGSTNGRWRVTSSGHLLPATDSTFNIGASGTEVLNLYVDNLNITGDVIGDGTDQLYGFLRDQVASTTTTISAAQMGKTFISNSADVMTLPEASTVLGARYTFVCGTADDFDINPADETDVIGPVSTTNGTTGVVTLSPSAGDAIRCTDIGGSITLEAIAADRWAQVAGGNGIWTDVN